MHRPATSENVRLPQRAHSAHSRSARAPSAARSPPRLSEAARLARQFPAANCPPRGPTGVQVDRYMDTSSSPGKAYSLEQLYQGEARSGRGRSRRAGSAHRAGQSKRYSKPVPPMGGGQFAASSARSVQVGGPPSKGNGIQQGRSPPDQLCHCGQSSRGVAFCLHLKQSHSSECVACTHMQVGAIDCVIWHVACLACRSALEHGTSSYPRSV